MAEKYLAGFPTVPCTVCSKPTPMLGTKLCQPCWELKQRLENYVPILMADAAARPKVVALLEQALKPKPVEPEPPKAA